MPGSYHTAAADPLSLLHCVQVQHLLASLNINPAELPADLAHVHPPHWQAAWQGPREGPLAADVAAAQRGGWDAVWMQNHAEPG
jgi:peroxin-5